MGTNNKSINIMLLSKSNTSRVNNTLEVRYNYRNIVQKYFEKHHKYLDVRYVISNELLHTPMMNIWNPVYYNIIILNRSDQISETK